MTAPSLPVRVVSAECPATADIFTVVVDDLGWNNVGWHNKEMQTPNADALAKDGIILDKS